MSETPPPQNIFILASGFTVERHLIIQELALRPSGEWQPDTHAWTVARVAEGAGYSLQGSAARELNAGDMVVVGPATQFTVRASQLGNLKLEFYVVLPQFLNGLVTLAEWRQLEEASKQPYPKLAHFAAADPHAQRFTRLAAQRQRDCLSSRSTMLQLWATSINQLLPPINTSTGQLVQLQDRFRELVGKMSEAELATRSLAELADKLHCSERHFSRLFRKEFKVSLRERQTELRLQRASQLLADSNSKIINVAYESGYRHLGLFNAMFKRRFGLTPSAWRQKNAVATGDPNFVRRSSMVLVTLLTLLQVFFSTDLTAQTANPAMTTNAAPQFRVTKYLVTGNSVLPADRMGLLFTNVPEAFGTNVTFDGIRHALAQLQTSYRERGFVTVSVGLPPQKLTNGVVKVRVTEGVLSDIQVQGNNWFSTPNVLRAMPGLHTNMLLNSHVFQHELDLANANRDRQIYPVISPGFEPGTSELTLKVKDRFPAHARVEWNNTGTPGTPPDRVNFSAQYGNLWQLEHQFGVQYGFSPLDFSSTRDYKFGAIDDPLVANYSAYYRMPLGQAVSVQQQIDQSSGKFGYNEITHQFQMPPPSGRPEVILYGSRSRNDTGINQGTPTNEITAPTYTLISSTPGQNITLNENIGFKYSQPLPNWGQLSGTFTAGLDFKHYKQVSFNTNLFQLVQYVIDPSSNTTNIIRNVTGVGQPALTTEIYYVPLNVGYNGFVPDAWGSTAFNIQGNVNLFNFDSLSLQGTNISHSGFVSVGGTKNAYVTVQAGVDRMQRIYKDWTVKLHADGQAANDHLFSNEQFGLGGIAGVRGYQDGAAYGDDGWRISIEPQTPLVNIGMVDGDQPFYVRGSIFMDYGELYQLGKVPAGTPAHSEFWGTGFGLTANIGSHFDARFALAFPLLTAANTSAGDWHLYFAAGAQF
jgi:hemolysin activation/secretion protein/AraC-like DNA-binding protein